MTRYTEIKNGIVALADTSLFIATEQNRPISFQPPDQVAVSIVTIAELRLGVLAAMDGSSRAQRLETLTFALSFDPIPIDETVANSWASLRLALRDIGKRIPINDSWIAATAIAFDLPVVSQDCDYDDIPGLHVMKI